MRNKKSAKVTPDVRATALRTPVDVLAWLDAELRDRQDTADEQAGQASIEDGRRARCLGEADAYGSMRRIVQRLRRAARLERGRSKA